MDYRFLISKSITSKESGNIARVVDVMGKMLKVKWLTGHQYNDHSIEPVDNFFIETPDGQLLSPSNCDPTISNFNNCIIQEPISPNFAHNQAPTLLGLRVASRNSGNTATITNVSQFPIVEVKWTSGPRTGTFETYNVDHFDYDLPIIGHNEVTPTFAQTNENSWFITKTPEHQTPEPNLDFLLNKQISQKSTGWLATIKEVDYFPMIIVTWIDGAYQGDEGIYDANEFNIDTNNIPPTTIPTVPLSSFNLPIGTRVCLNPNGSQYSSICSATDKRAGYIVNTISYKKEICKYIIMFDDFITLIIKSDNILHIDSPIVKVIKYLLNNGEEYYELNGISNPTLIFLTMIKKLTIQSINEMN